jgi:hypothetical protein
MVKYFLYGFFILFVIFYPVFESKSYKPVKYTKKEKIIPTVIYNGKFFIYNTILIKKGKFSKLDLYSKNYLKADDLSIYDLIKKERITALRAIYEKPFLKGFKVSYQNDQYTLNTEKALYDTKTSVLKGGEFNFRSADYHGYGKSFSVDKDKDIRAKEIVYFLKVKR